VDEGDKAIRLTDEQRIDWLRLIRSQNVGPRTFRALINHFGGAGAALDALPGLARRGGGRASPQIYSRDEAERELEAAGKLGAAFVAVGEADYPRQLQMIDDAPPLIAIRGNRDALAMPLVAVVGSRNASAAGIKMTQRLTHGLSEAGFGIVSGLARGIDAAAQFLDERGDVAGRFVGRAAAVLPIGFVHCLHGFLADPNAREAGCRMFLRGSGIGSPRGDFYTIERILFKYNH